jgi:hypothetical protein
LFPLASNPALQPADDRVDHGRQRVLTRRRGALRHREGVISVGYGDQGLLGRELGRPTERVALALDDEGR